MPIFIKRVKMPTISLITPRPMLFSASLSRYVLRPRAIPTHHSIAISNRKTGVAITMTCEPCMATVRCAGSSILGKWTAHQGSPVVGASRSAPGVSQCTQCTP